MEELKANKKQRSSKAPPIFLYILYDACFVCYPSTDRKAEGTGPRVTLSAGDFELVFQVPQILFQVRQGFLQALDFSHRIGQGCRGTL